MNAIVRTFRNMDPARFFVAVALVLSVFYICNASYLKVVPHEKGRFLHAVHLALSAMGKPDSIPVSFIDVVSQLQSPNESNAEMAANACHWGPQLNAKYCHPFPPGYQTPDFSQLASIPLKPENTVPFKSFIFAAQFSFVGYLFYVLGAALGILLGLPPIIIMYLSIATNALAALALGYFTLKIMPVLRWATCYLLLLPCAFLVRSLVMPDALTIELSLLTIATALHLFYFPRALTRKEMAGLVMLAFLTGFIKFAYFMVPFIYLVIPTSCFGSPRLKYAVISLAVLASIGAGAGWAGYIAETYYKHELTSQNAFSGAPLVQKIQGVVFHPLNSLNDVFGTLIKPGWILGVMDNLTRQKNHTGTLIAMLPLLFLTLLAEDPQARKDRWLRALAFAIFLGTVLVLSFVMYVHRNWSLSAAPYLVQGRYLLPVIPCLLLAMHSVIRFPENAHGWVRMEVTWLMILWLGWVHWPQLSVLFRGF